MTADHQHRLLALLLSHWEATYGVWGLDRHIRLQRLWAALPDKISDPDLLRDCLCPIFTTDARQQEAFWAFFANLPPAWQIQTKPEAETLEQAPAQLPADNKPDINTIPFLPQSKHPTPVKDVEPAQEKMSLELALEHCTQAPFTWNAGESVNPVPLDDSKDFQRLGLQLRRRALSGHARLDIGATMKATVNNAGIPVFRYKQYTRPPEYLLLVERFSRQDHRAGLFDYFYRSLRASEVLVWRFFYDGDLRICRNSDFPAGLTLTELHQRYPDARLLIWGAGQRLAQLGKRHLADWARPLLRWQTRVLLTPLSRMQWGEEEKILSRYFSLLPAAIQSLQYVADAGDMSGGATHAAWPDYLRRMADVRPIVLEEPLVRSLRPHFEMDMLAWIAACAVYPALHYNLTLQLGQLVSKTYGSALVTVDNMLALARLPWFANGYIPDEAREALMRYLEQRHPEAYTSVLQYLKDLLAQNSPPEHSAAWAEHQINLAILHVLTTDTPDEETIQQLLPVVKKLQGTKRPGSFVWLATEAWERAMETVEDKIWGALEPKVEEIAWEELEPKAEEFEFEEIGDYNPFEGVTQSATPRFSIIPDGTSLTFDEDLAGKVIQGCEVVRCIGVGGFTTIWLARDQNTMREVVIKIFRGKDENMVAAAQKEFQKTQNLSHPNIIQSLSFGTYQNYSFIVMPYFAKGSLMGYLGSLSEQETWKIVKDIGSALAYLHDQNILHLDIKPSNIFIDDQGNYILGDLGISMTISENPEERQRFGMTPMPYRAPECRSDSYPVKATDIWAFGATLYEIVTGELPFGEHGGLIQSAPLNDGVKNVEELIEDLPQHISGTLKRIIYSCLSANTWDRPRATNLVDTTHNTLISSPAKDPKRLQWELSFPAGLSKKTPGRVEPTTGYIIDHFTVLERIGSGTFGNVYKVRDTRDDQVYALKVLKLWEYDRRGQEKMRKRFELEFRTGQIQSEFLVEHYGCGELSGNPYIVMEYCAGGTLRNKINENISLRDIESYAKQILLGLSALHQSGRCHRELYPENILLDAKGRIRLAGFGIVGHANIVITQLSWLGRPNEQMGIYLYMPVEQISPKTRKETILPTIDIFAFGVVCYEMLTKRYPFGKMENDEDLELYLRRVKSGDWDDPIMYNPNMPIRWYHIIKRCLEVDYKNRLQNVSEVMSFIDARDTISGIDWNLTLPSFGSDISEYVELRPGSRIDDFFIIERLGSGAYGDTYKVRSAKSNEVFVIKIFKFWEYDRKTRDILIKRFDLEFQVGRTKSEFLVEHYGCGVIKGNPYIVMEYCTNRNLLEKINQGISLYNIEEYAKQILMGLRVLHQSGRVHRNINPDNILINKKGGAKLSGYGGEIGYHNVVQTNMGWMGRSEEQIGVYLYLSPEQVNPRTRNETVLPTIDIFAFGVVCYEMFTKHYPFGLVSSQDDLPEYLRRSREGLLDDPRFHNPDIPDRWLEIIRHCLEPDYTKRFQNVNEILSFLSPETVIGIGNKRITPILLPKSSGKKVGIIETKQWALKVIKGNEVGKIYNISQMMQGRQIGILRMGGLNVSGTTHNEIIIAGTSIWQATLELTSEGWTLRHGQHVNTEGQSGWFTPQNLTYLNDKMIKDFQSSKLKFDDIITIGNTILKVMPI